MTIEHISQFWDWVMYAISQNMFGENLSFHKYLGLFEGTSPKRFSFIAQTQNFIVDFKSTT